MSSIIPLHNTSGRLSVSLLISLLFHVFVLVSLQLFLLTHKTLTVDQPVLLTVRLAHLAPRLPKPVSRHEILTTKSPSPYKVAEVLPAPVSAAPSSPAPAADPHTATQEEPITGIAMPGSISTPFSGFKTPGNAFFAERHAQQDAMRAYREQALQMQAQQQAAQQSQLLTLRLQQLLASKLEAGALPPGICTLLEPATNGNHGLACNNNALYAAVANEQREIASLLMALRDQGSVYKGFSAERIADKLSVRLINTP